MGTRNSARANSRASLRGEPEEAGSKAEAIPFRVVVSKDGSVNDVQGIRVTAAQNENTAETLCQWKLKPYFSQGRVVGVETGVIASFNGRTTKQAPTLLVSNEMAS
jgi:hypothetical protein